MNFMAPDPVVQGGWQQERCIELFDSLFGGGERGGDDDAAVNGDAKVEGTERMRVDDAAAGLELDGFRLF